MVKILKDELTHILQSSHAYIYSLTHSVEWNFFLFVMCSTTLITCTCLCTRTFYSFSVLNSCKAKYILITWMLLLVYKKHRFCISFIYPSIYVYIYVCVSVYNLYTNTNKECKQPSIICLN